MLISLPLAATGKLQIPSTLGACYKKAIEEWEAALSSEIDHLRGIAFLILQARPEAEKKGDLESWREDWDACIELLREKEFELLLSPCMMRVQNDWVN
jgi:hypothetical protein